MLRSNSIAAGRVGEARRELAYWKQRMLRRSSSTSSTTTLHSDRPPRSSAPLTSPLDLLTDVADRSLGFISSTSSSTRSSHLPHLSLPSIPLSLTSLSLHPCLLVTSVFRQHTSSSLPLIRSRRLSTSMRMKMRREEMSGWGIGERRRKMRRRRGSGDVSIWLHVAEIACCSVM